jgi:peptidoglycan hydrolase-like protein with peptidoglycan-binding domain
MVTIKHYAGFIATAMLGLVLAGCSSTESQPAAAPAPAPMAAPQPAMPAPAPKPMTHQELIQSVQTALNTNGAKLTVDGRDGPKTAAALRAYQRGHNLKVTGRPDAETLKALGVQS